MRTRAPLFARVSAAALLGICLAASAIASAQGESDTLAAQRRIEAAYLYKFGSYISWPADAFTDPGSPFVIGVAGDDDMADELTTLVAGRSLNGRPVLVRKIRAGQSIAGLHILFVAAGTEQGGTLIDAARSNPTVCVTEGADGLGRGADMSFELIDDRVRFDVSLAAHFSGIKVSSQLLSVAYNVTGAKP